MLSLFEGDLIQELINFKRKRILRSSVCVMHTTTNQLCVQLVSASTNQLLTTVNAISSTYNHTMNN